MSLVSAKLFIFNIFNFIIESKLKDEAIELGKQFITNSNNISNNNNYREQFSKWHTKVKLVFLGYINDKIALLNENDNIYRNLRDILGLHDEHHNAEIKYTWYTIALKTKHDDVVEPVKKFLLSQGRMKYICPVIYAWLEFNRQDAIEFFESNKSIYHQIAVRLIKKKIDELI